MARPWLLTTLAVGLDGLAALVGGLLSDRWLSRHVAALVGFAAGALLGATFLDILPEALESFGRPALSWAFGGFVALAIIEWWAGPHHHSHGEKPHGGHGHGGHEHDHGRARAPGRGVLPVALLSSDALHNIGDGAAVAAAFLTSPRLGVITAVAVIAHEVPQEVGDYAILRAVGYPRGRALLALLVVQMTAALGALAMFLAAGWLRTLNGAVLSVAAGTFLYIGATDLLPELHSGRGPADRRERMLGFLGGIALILVATALTSSLGLH